MRYAAQVATEIGKTAYYPEEVAGVKITTRRQKKEVEREQ